MSRQGGHAMRGYTPVAEHCQQLRLEPNVGKLIGYDDATKSPKPLTVRHRFKGTIIGDFYQVVVDKRGYLRI